MRIFQTLSKFIVFAHVSLDAFGAPAIDWLMPANSLPSRDSITRDLDGDGDLDIVFEPGILSESNPHFQWMENLGNRQFSGMKLVALSLIPADTVWTASESLNLDQDGDLEFLISVMTPNGWTIGQEPPTHQPFIFDGNLGLNPTPLAESNSYPWLSVDLDADGQAEMIQFRGEWNESWDLAILRRNQDGKFTETATIDLVTDRLELDPVRAMKMLDLDLDGDLDLALEFSYGYHIVFRRTGYNSFDPSPVMIPQTSLKSSWADLDGDGLLDLLTWNFGWMKNRGNLVFDLQPRIANAEILTQRGAFGTHVVNRPGSAALLHQCLSKDDGGNEVVRLTVGAADFDFRQTISFSDEIPSASITSLIWVDLDGDGFLDLVHQIIMPNSWRVQLAVCWGTANSFSDSIPLQRSSQQTHLLAAHFNGDGLPDLLTVDNITGSFVITRNDGKGGFTESRRLDELHRTQSGELLFPRAVVGTADFNNDGNTDLVVDYSNISESDGCASVAILMGNGNLTFSSPSHVPQKLEGVPIYLPASGVANFTDWDGDGDLDIIVAGMWIKDEVGVFQVGNTELIDLSGVGSSSSESLVNLGMTSTGDLDVDGYPDVISFFQGTFNDQFDPLESPRIFIGFNDGVGGIAELIELPSTQAGTDALGNLTLAGIVRIADLDSDGLPDLWIGSNPSFDQSGNTALTGSWRKNPGNGSRDVSTWALLPLPEGTLPDRYVADFDADGTDEWVTFANYMRPTSSGPVRSEEFDFVGGANLSSYWVRAIDDFDGDGDADFLVGGSESSPLLLVRNSIVDHEDPLVARMRESGIPGALGGMDDDADGDGRTNFVELIEGTNLVVQDQSVSNPHQMSVSSDQGLGLVTYRVPWRVVGLGSIQSPVRVSDMGVGFPVESSNDLTHWNVESSGPQIMMFFDGTWNYFARAFHADQRGEFFRLRIESSQ